MSSKLPDRPSGPRRGRHGRGRRGPLMPMHLPAYRSRPERFDDAVMASAQRLSQRWPGEIEKIDFLIDPIGYIHRLTRSRSRREQLLVRQHLILGLGLHRNPTR